MQRSLWFIKVLLPTVIIVSLVSVNSLGGALPFVKQCQVDGGQVNLTKVSISADTVDLKGEVEILKELMTEFQISVGKGFFPIFNNRQKSPQP